MIKTIEWKNILNVTSNEDLELDESVRNAPYTEINVQSKQKREITKMITNWTNINTTTPTTLLKFEAENLIRIAGLPYAAEIHWVDDINGNRKKVICMGAGCPLCRHGVTTIARYYTAVIERTSGQAYIMEFGQQIAGQIQKNVQKSGDPTTYDLNIIRTGTGKQSRYTVLPIPPKTHLTQQEKDAAEKLDVAAYTTPKSLDEIYKMQLSILANDALNRREPEPEITDSDWDMV